MKIQKILHIIILLGIAGLFIQPRPAAAACNFHQLMTGTSKDISNFTSTCTISAVEGVDNASNTEGSTTNSAAITLGTGASITINSTGTLVTNALSITAGTIAIQTGGQIKLNTPLYIADADADGYAVDFTLYTASASGRRRLGLMRNFTTVDCGDSTYATDNVCCTVATRYQDADGDTYGNPSVSISACTTAGYVDNNTDCNDASASVFRTVAGYLDSDGDGYGAGAYTTCAGASGSYVASGADCYDANASAKPGSTTCSATNRGDGSFDYNCSGGNTVCGTQYYHSQYQCTHFWRPAQGCPCSGQQYGTVITSALNSGECGTSGNVPGGCFGDGTECQVPCAYTAPGAGGTQACQ